MGSNCARCGHAGSDVRIKACPNGCSYHARCMDLWSINHQTRMVAAPCSSSSSMMHPHHASSSDVVELTSCPCCLSPAAGFEIIPLSFAEIDQAQRILAFSSGGVDGGGGGGGGAVGGGKRSHVEATGGDGVDGGDGRQLWSYDPANPRTGKWTDEEIAFRDALVPHFVDGSLPLPMGLKLIEFLSSMLKSKPSRLTKKMKHAKLSTRHFQLKSGYVADHDRAREVSALELAFVNSISDPVERSEVRFHMQREWRDHVAERLTTLRISFDAEEWLRTVDVMDRRITLSKSRNRMVKRRNMMGKAMEKDTSSPPPGVFIDSTVDSHAQDDADFELLASALETNDHEDEDLTALWSSISAANAAAGGNNDPSSPGGYDGTTTSTSTARERGESTDDKDEGSSSHHSSPSSHPEYPISQITHPHPPPTPSFRSALLPSLGSAEGPNFKFAAPFLAKICGYIENNRIPFEHVDVWVPSSSDGYPNLDPTGATAPEPTVLGSGSKPEVARGRLVFAGSASVGVQIVSEDSSTPLHPSMMGGYDHKCKPGATVVPLSSDEIYHLSLFGSYSEKFSFSYGCGLPGRVFESAVPAWEQFITNAPPHLFERRGGAIQFGIKTAVGLPIRSPNVGRVVLVLYSRHNREKDDMLVANMVRDFQSLCPSPRWKLMVDMGNNTATPQQHPPQQVQQPQMGGGLASVMGGLCTRNIQLSDLISLLGENMPSDESTPLGQQLHNMMSLRLLLIRANRNPEEEQFVDSILFLFDSYIKAGRSRADTTLMLARDFAFHSLQNQQVHQRLQDLQPFQRQVSVPTMQHLSLGSSLPNQSPHMQHQLPPIIQFEHTHHGQNTSQASFSNIVSCSNPDFEVMSRKVSNECALSTMSRNSSSAPVNGGNMSMMEQNYSSSNFHTASSPNSDSMYGDPPMRLPNF